MRALIHVVSPTRHQFILFSLALVVFTIPALAYNDVYNGGAELGILGWDKTSTKYEWADVSISEYNRTGNSSFYMYSRYGPAACSISQDVKIKSGQNLSFYHDSYGVARGGYSYLTVKVDGNQVFRYGIYTYDGSYDTQGWVSKTVDLSAYQDGNTHTITFICEQSANTAAEAYSYIDDIRLTEVQTPLPEYPPSEEYIKFTSRSFHANETPSANYYRCYNAENLGYQYVPVFGYTHKYLYLKFNYGEWYNNQFYNLGTIEEQTLDYDEGPCHKTYQIINSGSTFKGYTIRGQLVEVTETYLGVIGVYGTLLQTTEEIIDTDYCYWYDESAHYEEPEDEPEEQPEEPEQPEDPEYPDNPDLPDIPDVPSYDSNYTPPQPQPGNNSTLGTAFLGGYYQTVDSIIGPINNTGSGALYFVMSPVNTVSSSVSQVNGYATSTFDRVLFYVSPFGLFFTVIFDAIPDDTEIIIMFSLVCGLILIVLRWK